MAYYSGTASSLADLRTALLTHAVADGWVLTGDVLSKAGVYFQIQVNADNITCLGCESNAVLNPAPNVASIGLVYKRPGYPEKKITFPASYQVFGFAQEFYLVVNYDVSYYQWLAFGKSTVPGLPGQGGWFGGSIGFVNPASSGPSGTAAVAPMYITATSGSYGHNTLTSYLTSGALFWQGNVANYGDINALQRNAYVNSGLDAAGWSWGATSTSGPVSQAPIAPLIAAQPSAWSNEPVLLPLRAFKERPSFKSSLVADLDNARVVRNDYFSGGQIITIGSDKWMAFPWYRKDIAARNGSTSTVGADHSGTFGWAIRYQGP